MANGIRKHTGNAIFSFLLSLVISAHYGRLTRYGGGGGRQERFQMKTTSYREPSPYVTAWFSLVNSLVFHVLDCVI